jgi:hypothetical protein
MMGLEPTTFCMASGSWVRPLNVRTLRKRCVSREYDVATRRANTRRLQAIPSGLGTSVAAVPNAGPTWQLKQGDWVEWRGLDSMDGTFTVLHVVFTDSESGERRTASATHKGTEKYGVFERLVRARRPMTMEEAQAIADEATEQLGGGSPGRYWATVRDDRSVLHETGEQRPVTEIRQGDTLTIEHAPGQLEVFDLTHDRDAGTILLQLSDGPMSHRADAELKLMNLESE